MFQPSRIKETLRFSPRTVLPPQRDSEPAKRSGAGAMYAVRFSRNFRDCVKKSLEKERKGVHDADKILFWLMRGVVVASRTVRQGARPVCISAHAPHGTSGCSYAPETDSLSWVIRASAFQGTLLSIGI